MGRLGRNSQRSVTSNYRLVNSVWRLVLLASLLLLQACATSSALVNARTQFKQGSTDAALETLYAADVSTRDRLLLFFDRALVAQAAGDYELSIVALENAYQLIDKLDYVSVRDQSQALLVNDWAIRYSGEFSERLWVHTFQMINYLMLDQPEGAAIEARRAVALYEEHGEVLQNDLFTRYLMILSFDAAGQTDSAMVEYRRLIALTDADALWKPRIKDKELVLLVATGFIEPKLPGDIVVDINARVSFPFYRDNYERAPDIDVFAGSRSLDTSRVDTRLLSIARSALEERGKSVAARHALRLAAKYAISERIADEDPLAGVIAQLFFLSIEQADIRSWETLPAYLTLIRIAVPEDETSVRVNINDTSYGSVSQYSRNVELTLDSRKRQFRMIRVGVADFSGRLSHP